MNDDCEPIMLTDAAGKGFLVYKLAAGGGRGGTVMMFDSWYTETGRVFFNTHVSCNNSSLFKFFISFDTNYFICHTRTDNLIYATTTVDNSRVDSSKIPVLFDRFIAIRFGIYRGSHTLI